MLSAQLGVKVTNQYSRYSEGSAPLDHTPPSKKYNKNKKFNVFFFFFIHTEYICSCSSQSNLFGHQTHVALPEDEEQQGEEEG